jgi:hypothetical protein
MDKLKAIQISGVTVLVFLMSVMAHSAVAQKVISPDELTTEQAVKDTFLTRIILQEADIDHSELIFEYNCIFDNCYIGEDLKETIVSHYGKEIKKVEYYYETIVNYQVPIETVIPHVCVSVNLTEYNCPETITSYDQRSRVAWIPINPGTGLKKGVHNIKVIVSYAPGLGNIAIDWIPIIELKQSRYPTIARDFTAVKNEWAWFNVSWWDCRDIQIGIGDNSDVVNHLVYNLNITNLTFSNATQEVRIVNAPCHEGGNVVDTQIYHSSDGSLLDYQEWAEVAFRFNGTNTTYSVYYNATGSQSEMNEFIVSKGNLSAELWDKIGVSAYQINETIIKDVPGATQIYQQSSDPTPDGDENAQYTILFNTSTDYLNFTTDELNYVWARLYTNQTHNGGIRACKTVDCNPSGSQQVNYWPPWSLMPNITYDWVSGTNLTTYLNDMYGFAFYMQNAPNDEAYMYGYLDEILFCKDCNVSDNLFVTIGEQQQQIEPWSPGPPANLTLELIYDPSDLGVISRATCDNSEWLRVNSFVRECVGEEGNYTANCYWINSTKLYYCENGCYNSTDIHGATCAPMDYTIILIGVIILILGIAFISWIYGRRG